MAYKRAILSGGGQVVDAEGNPILSLGFDVVPHGQEIPVWQIPARCVHECSGYPLQRTSHGSDGGRQRWTDQKPISRR